MSQEPSTTVFVVLSTAGDPTLPFPLPLLSCFYAATHKRCAKQNQVLNSQAQQSPYPFIQRVTHLWPFLLLCYHFFAATQKHFRKICSGENQLYRGLKYNTLIRMAQTCMKIKQNPQSQYKQVVKVQCLL